MSGQDWNPVNIGNKTNPKSNNKTNNTTNNNKDPKKILEEKCEEGIFNKPQVDLNLKIMIQQARMVKKMTQKDLSTILKIKHEIIRNIENGKLIPDNMTIAKLSRVLGVKLPRNKKQ